MHHRGLPEVLAMIKIAAQAKAIYLFGHYPLCMLDDGPKNVGLQMTRQMVDVR
jgi:hypothetical protein